MHILIDDERDLNCDIICRNSDAAKYILASLRIIEYLYIDYNLGENSETGYDVLKWMIDELSLRRIRPLSLPLNIQLVTFNPIGKNRMKNLLINNGYETKDGTNFKINKEG